MRPSSTSALRLSPTSTGKISSFVSTGASSREIASPALTSTLSFLTTTFPWSMAAGTPAFWSSPTIGPGLKGRSSALIVTSSLAISPPFAGAFDFVASSFWKSLKGLRSDAMNAGWPVRYWSSFVTSPAFGFASLRAIFTSVFFATKISAEPRSPRRMMLSWFEGIPRMSRTPTTFFDSRDRTRPDTTAFFPSGMCFDTVNPLEQPLCFAHRGLHVDGVDVEPPASQACREPLQDRVDVLGELLGAHARRPHGRVERALVARADAHGRPHRLDDRLRVRARGDGLRHLPARPQDHAEPPADCGHQGRLREEEVRLGRELLGAPLVRRDLLDLLGGDHEVGHRLRADRKLAGGEHAHPHGLAAPVGELDFLVNPVRWDREVHVLEVDCEFDGLDKIALRALVERLLDRLQRFLVDHRHVTPVVRAGGLPPLLRFQPLALMGPPAGGPLPTGPPLSTFLPRAGPCP